MPWRNSKPSPPQWYKPQTFLAPVNNPLATAPLPSLGMVSARARAQMVHRLEKLGIKHHVVLAAMNSIDRHIFVDTALASRAYEDIVLPIGFKQNISQPSIVAGMMTLACEAQRTNGVWLEIGTGCGYQAAIMARCTTHVCSIERIEGLHLQAIDTLKQAAIQNISLCLGDGIFSWRSHHQHLTNAYAYERFDAIIVAAAGMSIAPSWLEQLHVGGRLIAPIQNESGIQHLHLIERCSESFFEHHILQAVQFVPLLAGIA